LDRHVLILDEACFLQALPNAGELDGLRLARLHAEDADDWHRPLLRARRHRPRTARCRRAAEQCDNLAPLQSMELHPLPQPLAPVMYVARRRHIWAISVS